MFRPLALTPPPALDALAGDLAASLEDMGASLAAGAGSLGELGLPPLPPLPPLPGSPPSAEELRGTQSALLSRSAQCLMLSPYDYGIGQRQGEEAWLTPADALRGLADRLGAFAPASSLGDAVSGGSRIERQGAFAEFTSANMAAPQERTKNNGALVLVIAASVDQAGMGQLLQSLNTAFPMPELQKLERRAKGVANLALDKFVIPSAPAWPPRGKRGPESLPLSREASRAVGAQLAQSEGREAAQKGIGEVMGSFAERQAAAVQKTVQDLQAVAGQLTAGADLSGWFGLYLEGAAAEVGRLLAGMAPPVDEVFKCASVLCWYGEREEVAYYKELFGL